MRERNSINYDKMYLLKQRLDAEVQKRNTLHEVSKDNLDPIIVAHKYKDPTISLVCALFSYGNVKQIVSFLESLDFSLLQKSDEEIQNFLQNHYYRFQKSEDIIALFIALKRIKQSATLEKIFENGYSKHKSVIDGINELITSIHDAYPHQSRGYTFLLSKTAIKTKGSGALKRWMMYLRWMVRNDNIDMGLWSNKYQSDLIIPLDTHTFNVSRRIGLLFRKTYDLQAALDITEQLKKFDKNDPIKYDFALYRIGQEKLL